MSVFIPNGLNDQTQPLTRKQKHALKRKQTARKHALKRAEFRKLFELTLEENAEWFGGKTDYYEFALDEHAYDVCMLDPAAIYIPEPTEYTIDYMFALVKYADLLRPQQIRLLTEALMRDDEETRDWVLEKSISICRDERMMRSLLDASGRDGEDAEDVINALMAKDRHTFSQEHPGCLIYPW